MKRSIILLPLLLLLAAAAPAQQLCTVRGQILDNQGRPLAGAEIVIRNVQLVTGTHIISRISTKAKTDANGRFAFNTFRNALVHLQANTVDSLYYGKTVYIPDADSVNLMDLPIGSPDIPPRYVVAVASYPAMAFERGGILVADTIGTVNFSDDFDVTEGPSNTVNVSIDSYKEALQAQLDTIRNTAIAAINARMDSIRNAAIAQLEQDVASNAANITLLDAAQDTLRQAAIAALQVQLDTIRNAAIASIEQQLKKHADTLAAHLARMDAMITGGASLFTDAGDWIYRNGPVSVGTTASPRDKQAGFRVDLNIWQHPDSSARFGKFYTPSVVWDTIGYVQLDTVSYKINSVRYFPSRNGLRDVVVELGISAPGKSSRDFRIVADSNAGFIITAIDIITHGAGYSYAYPPTINRYEGYGGTSMVSVYWDENQRKWVKIDRWSNFYGTLANPYPPTESGTAPTPTQCFLRHNPSFSRHTNFLITVRLTGTLTSISNAAAYVVEN